MTDQPATPGPTPDPSSLGAMQQSMQNQVDTIMSELAEQVVKRDNANAEIKQLRADLASSQRVLRAFTPRRKGDK